MPTMRLKLLVALCFGLTLAIPGLATPVIERVTPTSIPHYIEVEITAVGCDAKAMTKDYVAIWYATVKAKVADLEGGKTRIAVYLRNPLTGAFLFNAGGQAQQEGQYVQRSIAFDSTILDQVVFEWSDGVSRSNIRYEIHLTDFYSGERC